ncbi:MAG TPA: TerC family protein [Bacillota bacterium]|jgi:tellurite resistance protein TerC
MQAGIWVWTGFTALILALLALDLGVFNRKVHAISIKEATIWSIVWIIVALLFNVVLYFWAGREAALQFLAGYIIERSLSFDNIFVFVLIFSYFAIPSRYQHRVLFWGILGALVLRAVMIVAGISLINAFHWTIYVFGAFLLYSGYKIALQKGNETMDIEGNPIARLVQKFLPFSPKLAGHRFLTRVDGKLMFTPLLLVLIIVETSDVVFAVDSIPAIFGVTRDPFLVYSSNVFAILGLRAFYFLLAGVIDHFRYLKIGLGFILAFVGLKMLTTGFVDIRTDLSLGVILLVLAISIAASLMIPERKGGPSGSSA